MAERQCRAGSRTVDYPPVDGVNGEMKNEDTALCVSPPAWQAMLSALLVHGSTIGFLDPDEDMIEPKGPRRRLTSGKPTGLTVGLSVGGKSITAVRCTDRKVRLPAADLGRLIGVQLGDVPGLPALLGNDQLQLMVGLLAMKAGARQQVSTLNGLLVAVVEAQRLLRSNAAKPWIAQAKHGPVHVEVGLGGIDSPRVIRSPDVVELLAKLGLPTTATQDDVRTRFRELAKVHHPDKSGDDRLMKALNEAHARPQELLG